MKQTEKLDNLIKKIIKEELNKSQKGVLDVTIPSKIAFALQDPRVSDDPSYVPFMKSKDNGKTYNLVIQSKTPAFKELKKAMGRIDSVITITPELSSIYDDIMAGIEKADVEGSVDLIKQGRKSGLEEKKLSFVTSTGDNSSLTPDQISQLKNAKAGDTVSYTKAGQAKEASEEEQKKEVLDNEPKASDIAGKVSEILDQLKTMSEGGKDPKKQKLAARAMKQMESAKIALEALTAHEVTLEQKEEEGNQKNAQKHVAKFKKALTKLVKEPAAVEKIAAKMTPEKMALLKKKMKNDELDEEKLAKVMLQHSLKEGWIK
jgi:hypothetical protein